MKKIDSTVLYIIGAVIIVFLIGIFFYSQSTQVSTGQTSATKTPAVVKTTTPPGTPAQKPGQVQTIVVPPTPPKTTMTPAQISAKKAEILKITSVNRVLTDVERKTVNDALIGNQIMLYNFTQPEIKKVFDSLNRSK